MRKFISSVAAGVKNSTSDTEYIKKLYESDAHPENAKKGAQIIEDQAKALD